MLGWFQRETRSLRSARSQGIFLEQLALGLWTSTTTYELWTSTTKLFTSTTVYELWNSTTKHFTSADSLLLLSCGLPQQSSSTSTSAHELWTSTTKVFTLFVLKGGEDVMIPIITISVFRISARTSDGTPNLMRLYSFCFSSFSLFS